MPTTVKRRTKEWKKGGTGRRGSVCEPPLDCPLRRKSDGLAKFLGIRSGSQPLPARLVVSMAQNSGPG